MDAIRASGKLFLDKEFPPTINSIGDNPYIGFPVHWMRAKEIILRFKEKKKKNAFKKKH